MSQHTKICEHIWNCGRVLRIEDFQNRRTQSATKM